MKPVQPTARKLLVPLVGKVLEMAAFYDRIQQGECVTDNGELGFGLVSRPEVVSHRKVDENATGRIDLCDQVTTGGHADRGNPCFFR